MSSKQNGKNREYEVAATELVDLEDFRKYMAEEEEEEALRQTTPEVPEQAPQLSPRAASTAPDPSLSTQRVPVQSAPVRETGADNAKLAAILGIVSLIPLVGLLVGPAAMTVANKQKQEIVAGRATAGGLQQANIGLYLGAIGTAVSLLFLVYILVF